MSAGLEISRIVGVASEHESLLRELAEARVTARQLELMVEALKDRLRGMDRQDVLALGVRLCDLRLQLLRVAERAETVFAERQKDGEPIADGGTSPPGEHLH